MLSDVSLKKEFLRALSGSSAVYLFGTFMGFLVGIQLARGLGVAGYGLYGSAMAAASLGATIASGGVQLHATREIAAYKAHSYGAGVSRLVAWSTHTVFAISVALALGVGAYVLWGQGASLKVASAAMALTILMAFLALTGAIVRGSGALILGQALNVAIRPTVQSCLLLIGMLSIAGINPVIALSIACVAALVAMFFGFRVIRRLWRYDGAQVLYDAANERRIWRRAAWTMGLTTAVRAAEAALPLIVIGALASMEQAGLYRVASSAIVLPSMAGTMITIMVPALVVRVYEDGKSDRLRRLAAASCIFMTAPTIVIALVLWIFGGPLLTFAFGSGFEPAWTALALLTIGAVVSALGGISIALLHAARKEGVVTQAFTLSLAVSAGGSLWFAPQYGASGVAAAVLCGVAARTAWLAYASRRFVGIDPTLPGALHTIFFRRSRRNHA